MEQTNPPARRRRQASNFKSQYLLIVLAAVLVIGAVAALTSYLSADFSLTPVGGEHITVEFGTPYQDAGVTANYSAFLSGAQSVDAEVTVTGQVSQETLGTYTLTYTATFRGKTAQTQRTVTIVDTQKPVISLVYNSNSYTLPGHLYVEEGFSAEDNYDGNITDRVERRMEGDTVIYRVKDSSGNMTVVTRPIQYGDFTPPEIVLKGDSTVTIYAGDQFTDPGFTATDNADGDVTGKVTVSKDHSTYVPGTYTITYTVTDTYGNTATATRTLVVEARQQTGVVEPNGKVIYLTFDDGPSQYTLELLDILDKYNVKATFFVVGEAATGHLKKIVDRGHAIAIHSVTHDYETIYASKEAFFDDLYGMQKIIQDKTGVLTTLMRFPGGSSNEVSKKYCTGIMTELTKAVEAQGFQYFDWNVDSRDASDAKTEDQVFENVTKGVQGRKYSIVLQHDIKGYSVKAVDRIIAWGLANGYSFEALTPSSPTAHHPVNN